VIYGFSMNIHGVFRTGFLLLLLLLADSASARPYTGWVQFDFPGTTSLHDCSWLESAGPADRTACSDVLSGNQAQSREADLDEDTRKHLGFFGDHPLFFLHAVLLHCEGGECSEARDIRVGPPENTWSAPVMQNLGSHLLYHMPSELHGKKHVLKLAGLTDDWQSEPFSAPFRHNYLMVGFDKDHPGRLVVEMNWKRSLSDPANASRLLSDAEDMLMIWLGLLLVSACIAVLMGLDRRFPWAVVGRAWIAHAVTLLALLALTFLPPWSNGISLIALPLLYVATLPLDARFIRKPGGAGLRRAMFCALVLRLGTTLLVAAGAWTLSLR